MTTAQPFSRTDVRRVNDAITAAAVGGSGRTVLGVLANGDVARIAAVRTRRGVPEGRVLGGAWTSLTSVRID